MSLVPKIILTFLSSRCHTREKENYHDVLLFVHVVKNMEVILQFSGINS